MSGRISAHSDAGQLSLSSTLHEISRVGIVFGGLAR